MTFSTQDRRRTFEVGKPITAADWSGVVGPNETKGASFEELKEALNKHLRAEAVTFNGQKSQGGTAPKRPKPKTKKATRPKQPKRGEAPAIRNVEERSTSTPTLPRRERLSGLAQ